MYIGHTYIGDLPIEIRRYTKNGKVRYVYKPKWGYVPIYSQLALSKSQIVERLKNQDREYELEIEADKRLLEKIDWNSFCLHIKEGKNLDEAMDLIGMGKISRGRFRNLMFEKSGTKHANGFVKGFESQNKTALGD